MKCHWFLFFVFCLYSASALNIDSNNQLLEIYESALEIPGVSDACQTALNLFIDNIQSQTDTWALQMLDSTSKIPVGIFRLNLGEVGQYSQCLATQSQDGLIQPRYCLGSLNISLSQELVEQQNKAYQIRKMTKAIINLNDEDDNGDDNGGDEAVQTMFGSIGISWAVCLPSQCTSEDIQTVLGTIINQNSLKCQTKDDLNLPLTTGAITTIAIFSVIAFIMVASTVLDLYYNFVANKAPPHLILIAFSVYTNGGRLFSISKNANELTCLNGIRFISMLWVVIGHSFANYTSFPLFNYLDVWEWFDTLRSMTIVSGTLSVDSFFFMSGLLLVYGYMKAKHQGVKFNIFLFYFHRFLRLTPALAAAVLFTATLLRYTGTGPKWNSIYTLEDGCSKFWWSTLLYVQNYVNFEKGFCLGQTWYLSVDMQLYILTPLVLLPLKYPKIGVSIIITTIVAFLIVPFCVAYITEIPALIINYTARVSILDYMKLYYMTTHGRAAPWFMGVLFGYFLAKMKFNGTLRTVKLNKILVILLWVLCVVIGLVCIYGGHDTLRGPDYSIWASSFYIALQRPAWTLCLLWVVFACVTGYGGPVDWFLSFPIYQVLNRFTYSIYLIHYPLLSVLTYSAKTAVYFDEMTVAFFFWGVTMFSFFISVIWVLAFESPITVLEKIIFSHPKKASKPEENGKKDPLPA